tara:strand:+ start:3479 stop:4123 length:645 start_codon:yes stop_codon:yes gene_type:complete
MILNKKIFLFLVFTFFIFGSFIIKAQSEKKDKTILIPSESSPSLLNPKKNMSLNFKLNDLSPNTNKTPEINMMDQEDFIDPSEYYTARMNKKKGEKSKNSNLLKKDIYLGDFKTGDENINVVFRDHEYPDGDIIQIKVNDKVVINSIILQEQFRGINIELENGFNRIDFIALNQGESGPNTAELKVYTHSGSLVGSNRWNLATGAKATYIVVKE